MKSRVSTNFIKADWACSCGCGQLIIDERLVAMMETVQYKIYEQIFTSLPTEEGKIILHSVNRCLKKNRSIPGSRDSSWHIPGGATDWHVEGWTIKQLHDFVRENHGEFKIFYGGAGFYSWGVHTDLGSLRIWGEM